MSFEDKQKMTKQTDRQQKSLILTIDYFNKSIDKMNSTVLVPMRLKNIKSDSKCDYNNNPNGSGDRSDSDNGFDDIEEDGDDLIEEDINGTNNLYDSYNQLNCIRKNLVQDKQSEDDSNKSSIHEDCESEQIPIETLKVSFDYHVNQLSLILNQLIKQADVVTNSYIVDVNKQLIIKNGINGIGNRMGNGQKKEKHYYICVSNDKS